MPFADNSFDAVICSSVLYHQWVKDVPAAVCELRRVLRPGGLLILNLPAFNFLHSPHDEAVMTARRFRAPEVRALLADNGFVVQRLTYWTTFLFPFAALARALSLLKSGRDFESGARAPAGGSSAASWEPSGSCSRLSIFRLGSPYSPSRAKRRANAQDGRGQRVPPQLRLWRALTSGGTSLSRPLSEERRRPRVPVSAPSPKHPDKPDLVTLDRGRKSSRWRGRHRRHARRVRSPDKKSAASRYAANNALSMSRPLFRYLTSDR